MVGADLMSFVTTHQQTNFLGFLVLKELDITDTTFLPFLQALVITEKLGAPVRDEREKEGAEVRKESENRCVDVTITKE
jgi:hypothetical protein